jgi:hypothetical protein
MTVFHLIEQLVLPRLLSAADIHGRTQIPANRPISSNHLRFY